MAKYIPSAIDLNLRSDGLVFEVGSLFAALLSLHDPRCTRITLRIDDGVGVWSVRQMGGQG